MNINRLFKVLNAILCSVLISGCGSNPVFDVPPDDGMALIYLYRTSSLSGADHPTTFSINKRHLGKIKSFPFTSGYFKVSLAPGKHEVRVYNSSPIIVNARPGEIIFMRHAWGNRGFTQVQPSIAKKEISDLKMFKANFTVMNENYISPEEIAWLSCKNGSDAGICQRFVTDFPKSQHATYAINLIKEIKATAENNRLNAKFERDKQLPVEVRRDKYMVALTSHLKNERYQEAMQYFGFLERLNTKLAPSFNYFYGEALLKTGKPNTAITKFYAYIQKVGAKGKYYKKALELVNQAESTL